jgi:valyl-tRNA synthetase
MPFITEEIWQTIYEGRGSEKSIALVHYPLPNDEQVDLTAEAEMGFLQDLIVSIRNLRAELEVEPKERVPVEIFVEGTGLRRLIDENCGALERLAGVQEARFVSQSLARISGARHTARFDVRLVYEKQVDMAAEREKRLKELAKINQELEHIVRQLDNQQFVAKAPAHVVEKLQARRDEANVLREKIEEKLEELK